MHSIHYSESEIFSIRNASIKGELHLSLDDLATAWGVIAPAGNSSLKQFLTPGPDGSLYIARRGLCTMSTILFEKIPAKREKCVAWVLRYVSQIGQSDAAAKERILKAITEAGAAGVALSGLQRYTQNMTPESRQYAIDDLLSSGAIVAKVMATKTRPRTEYVATDSIRKF